jgi:hypothetical protein
MAGGGVRLLLIGFLVVFVAMILLRLFGALVGQ